MPTVGADFQRRLFVVPITNFSAPSRAKTHGQVPNLRQCFRPGFLLFLLQLQQVKVKMEKQVITVNFGHALLWNWSRNRTRSNRSRKLERKYRSRFNMTHVPKCDSDFRRRKLAPAFDPVYLRHEHMAAYLARHRCEVYAHKEIQRPDLLYRPCIISYSNLMFQRD